MFLFKLRISANLMCRVVAFVDTPVNTDTDTDSNTDDGSNDHQRNQQFDQYSLSWWKSSHPAQLLRLGHAFAPPLPKLESVPI